MLTKNILFNFNFTIFHSLCEIKITIFFPDNFHSLNGQYNFLALKLEQKHISFALIKKNFKQFENENTKIN